MAAGSEDDPFGGTWGILPYIGPVCALLLFFAFRLYYRFTRHGGGAALSRMERLFLVFTVAVVIGCGWVYIRNR